MMNKSFQEPNLTMLTDFYELTMANGYFANGFQDTICYFDMFFRKVPDNGGFAIMAGVEQLVEYLQNLTFTEEDIQYLHSKHIFSEKFLEYLRDFTFSCDVWAIPEGTPKVGGQAVLGSQVQTATPWFTERHGYDIAPAILSGNLYG